MITIDGLAVMVAKGFDRVEDRIGNVEKRLGGVEERLGGVEERLGNVEESLKVTRRDILNIGDRFVPRFEFDNLLIRVGKLEQKGQGKSR